MTEADERNLRRAVDTGAIARSGLGRVARVPIDGYYT
jgi:hypothetical protein